jgi:hypothetical protein
MPAAAPSQKRPERETIWLNAGKIINTPICENKLQATHTVKTKEVNSNWIQGVSTSFDE